MKISIYALSLLSLIFGLEACQNQTPKSNLTTEDQALIDRGLEAVQASSAALTARLQAAMKEGGPEKAIEICQIHALPITDSISKVKGLKLRRLSDRNRNPNNQAQGPAMANLEAMRAELAQGLVLKPRIHRSSGEKTRLYYPILTQELCLKCHGQAKKDLNPETLAALQTRYPQDRALGYEVGMLRGLWEVTLSD